MIEKIKECRNVDEKFLEVTYVNGKIIRIDVEALVVEEKNEQSEALELFECYKYAILSWVQISEEELNVIEQTLEQAQENKAKPGR